jgi:hypothetical protein
MVGTKEGMQSAPTTTQIRSDGQAVRTQMQSDLPHREVGVVVEDDGGALSIWELPQSGMQVRILISVRIAGRFGDRPPTSSPLLELSGGDPEGRSPDPCAGVANGGSSTDGLGVGVSDGFARDLGVAGERTDGSPKPAGVLSVQGLDAPTPVAQGQRCIHHLPKGLIHPKR